MGSFDLGFRFFKPYTRKLYIEEEEEEEGEDRLELGKTNRKREDRERERIVMTWHLGCKQSVRFSFLLLFDSASESHSHTD